jgi:hypothetical protein
VRSKQKPIEQEKSTVNTICYDKFFKNKTEANEIETGVMKKEARHTYFWDDPQALLRRSRV